MAAQIAKFAKEKSKREELDEELNKICATYNHPMGATTLKIARVEVGFQRGYGAIYDNKEYQACRFCGLECNKQNKSETKQESKQEKKAKKKAKKEKDAL